MVTLKGSAPAGGAGRVCLADFRALLSRHGVRPTSQRLRVAQVLLDRPRHLSADQVMSRVNRGGKLVSLATVYNTLRLFVDRGLVNALVIDPGKVYYDSNTRPHDHIYNEDTGELIDLEKKVALRRALPLPPGTETLGVNLVVRVRSLSSRKGAPKVSLSVPGDAPDHGPE